MAKKESNSTSGGIGFSGLLAILFIGLKLAGIIDWSWWWVLAPIWLWIPILLLFVIIFVIGLIIALDKN